MTTQRLREIEQDHADRDLMLVFHLLGPDRSARLLRTGAGMSAGQIAMEVRSVGHEGAMVYAQSTIEALEVQPMHAAVASGQGARGPVLQGAFTAFTLARALRICLSQGDTPLTPEGARAAVAGIGGQAAPAAEPPAGQTVLSSIAEGAEFIRDVGGLVAALPFVPPQARVIGAVAGGVGGLIGYGARRLDSVLNGAPPAGPPPKPPAPVLLPEKDGALPKPRTSVEVVPIPQGQKAAPALQPLPAPPPVNGAPALPPANANRQDDR